MNVDLPSLILITAAALEKRVLAAIAEAGHAGVRPSHGYVFQRLLTSEPTIAELGKALKITPQGASKAVKELETLGYVYTRQGKDSRERRVVLSAAGAAVVAVARSTRESFSEQVRTLVGDEAYTGAMTALAAAVESLGLSADVADRSVAMPEN